MVVGLCHSPTSLLAISASSSSWRFTFYLIAFIAGMAVIVDVSGDSWEMGVDSLARWDEATEFGSFLLNLSPSLCRNPGSMT